MARSIIKVANDLGEQHFTLENKNDGDDFAKRRSADNLIVIEKYLQSKHTTHKQNRKRKQPTVTFDALQEFIKLKLQESDVLQTYFDFEKVNTYY